MAAKRQSAKRQSESAANPDVVKLTVRISSLTAKRLGVESVMTGKSQSDIVESVLAVHLAGWRLPSKAGVVGTYPESSDFADAN